MNGVIEAFQVFANQFGYLGVLAISLFGSAIPFVPLPYLAVVVVLSGSQNPLLLGLAAGAGGALGKVTSYFLGRFGYLAVGSQTKESLDVLHNALARYGVLGVFVFSVTPLPDDVYVVPMGIIRLPFWKFFAANLAGKIVLSVSVAYLGQALLLSMDSVVGDSSVVVVTAGVATLILSLVVIRADWTMAIRIAQARGIRGLVADLPEVLRFRKKSSE